MSGSDKHSPAAFDAFAEEYDALHRKNLGILGKDVDVFARYKVRLTAELLSSPPETVLEFGCGTGKNLPFLHQYFPGAAITACDVSDASLQKAQKRLPDAICFNSASPETLTPFCEAFDLVFISCVLHHIPLPERQAWINALAATVRNGKCLMIFEHNPWNPITRYLVSTCPFDQDAVLVRPQTCMEYLRQSGLHPDRLRYTLLFPWRNAAFAATEKIFDRLPLGGQYCLSARKS